MKELMLIIFMFTFLIVNHQTMAVPQAAALDAAYYVATNGSNSNPGTLVAPWRTIQHAMNTAVPGDVVQVRGGVYNEAVSVNVSGSAGGGYITLQAYPGETAVLDGQNSRTIGFSLDNVSYLIIDGFEIRHFASNANWVLAAGVEIREGAHHIHLLNNKIHAVQATPPNLNTAIANGIGVYGTSNSSVNNILIDGNALYDLTLGWSESLVVNGNVEFFTITNNVIHDNDNIGIDVIGGESWLEEDEGVLPALNQARDGVVADNVVYNIDSATNLVYEGDRSAPCLYVDGGTRVTIERNTVYNCNFGVSIGSERAGFASSYVTLQHNVVYDSLKAGLVMGGSNVSNGGSMFNTILNNTFFKSDTLGEGGGELWVQQKVENNVIKNNIFYATGQNIALSNFNATSSGNVIDYNLYFAPGGAGGTQWIWNSTEYSSFAAWKAATGFDAHSSFGDPQFVSTTLPDLHLQAGSTAVNAGDNLPEPTTDIDRDLRAADCTPDIGADEVLFALPLAVSNTVQNGTTLTLQWEALAGSAAYRVHHETTPYFPVSGVPAWEGSDLSFDGTGHLGSSNVNNYYVVQSMNCETTTTAVFPRFGEFDFAILSGN